MEKLIAGFRFYRSLRLVFGLGVLVITFVFVVIWGTYMEYKNQTYFQQQYGKDWEAHYVSRFGPDAVQRGRNKIILGLISLPLTGTIVYFIVRMASNPGGGGTSSGRRRRRRHRH